MKKLDFSIPFALAFSIPAIVIFLIFMHYLKTNTPVFNIFIDALIILTLSSFWILFIVWVEDRDIDGNPFSHYETLSKWKEWYYKKK